MIKKFSITMEEISVAVKEIIEENSQLKQQLAEKDQAIESLEELNKSLGQTCNNDRKEIERLNKLLAEKDKSYKWTVCKLCEIEINKDKISFAVEQLEKVKKFCEKFKLYSENINYVIVEEKNGIRCNPTLYEEIDSQIEILKEGK